MENDVFHDLAAWLLGLLVVQPLQAEVQERLGAARAPAAVVRGVVTCARDALPGLADRALSDPLWALSTGGRVWFGVASPFRVLRDVAPGCGPALDAAEPFLDGRSA